MLCALESPLKRGWSNLGGTGPTLSSTTPTRSFVPSFVRFGWCSRLSQAGWLGYITNGASCTVITTCTRVIIADKRPTDSEPCDLCTRRKQNGYLVSLTMPRHAYGWLTSEDVVERSYIDSHSDSGVLLFREKIRARAYAFNVTYNREMLACLANYK